MNNNFRILISFITLVLLLNINLIGIAQPPPPPPGGEHGQGSNSPPGSGAGAPIGDGMFILLGLAGLYGGKKVYDLINQSVKNN